MRTEPIANPATVTPVEIDTRATELTFMITKLNNEIKRLERHQEFGWTIDVDKLLSLKADQRDLTREYCSLSNEFSARGTWNRYYLALSHNGHVHSSMRCSTCNKGGHATQFIRLDAEAGATPETVVAKAKVQACTTCFPWAPVTTERGEYRTPDQEEKERRAVERAERKAAADAKKITTPDGQPLREAMINFRTGEMVDSHEIKTAVSARRKLVEAVADMACYSTTHPDFRAWQETARRCAEALAARPGFAGTTQRQLFADAIAKVRAKAKRESWDVNRDFVKYATPRP